MAASYHLANALLDLVFRGTAWTPPATLYATPSTTTPARDGTNITEPSGFNYSRLAVTNNLTNFPAAVGGSKANAADFNFNAAVGGSWGAITHLCWKDASSGGNLLSYFVGPNESIDDTDVLQIAIAKYVATFSGTIFNHLKNELLDHYVGASVYTPPATHYAFASLTAPNADGTGVTEPVGFGYARKAVTNNSTNFNAASNGQKTNATEIAWAAASGGSWGTIPYFGFADALTGGNYLTWQEFPSPRVINSGSILRVAASQMIAAIE